MSDLSDALEKMYADLCKGIYDLFPLGSQQVPPAFQAKVHIPPLQSGFLVPPALWEGALAANLEKSITSPPGVTWTRPAPPAWQLDPLLNAEHNARKLSAIIDVPNELLMADGLIPDTRPPRKPLPWRWRAKWKLRQWREDAACLAYRAIAGKWPDNGEDDW